MDGQHQRGLREAKARHQPMYSPATERSEEEFCPGCPSVQQHRHNIKSVNQVILSLTGTGESKSDKKNTVVQSVVFGISDFPMDHKHTIHIPIKKI